ncbi:MAG: Ig-like domain-containing protein [Actinomycetota bacterium]|nr:Ig-like domain-containing protein [Actinomycetota bacterium]
MGSGQPGGCGGVAPSRDPQPPDADCESIRTSVNGERGTGSSSGGGGGGSGGGYWAGGKGHGAPDSDARLFAGGSGGGGGRSYADAVDPSQVAYTLGDDGRSNANGHVTLIVPFPAKRAEVEILGGNKQSALPGQGYARALSVRALDPDGIPIAKRPITFFAPPHLLGPGDPYVVFPDGATDRFVTKTDSDGKASVMVKAPGVPWSVGAFGVTAAVDGGNGMTIKPASFSLYNESLPTQVTLTSSAPGNRSDPDQGVVFTASVALDPANPYAPGSNPYGATPTGSVRFSVSGVPGEADVPLDATGTAVSPAYPGLAPGTHRVTATYGGDTRQIYATSTANLAQASGMSSPVMSLSSSQPSATFGTALQATSVVKPPAGTAVTPTGRVQFSIDGGAFGEPVPLSADGIAASTSKSDLGVGVHAVDAHYLGDDGFLPASQTLEQKVQGSTSVALATTSYPNRTFTAQVTSPTPGVTQVVRGTVTFTNASDKTAPVLATVPLDPTGKATTPAVNLCCYVNDVVATYEGEDRLLPSRATMTAYDVLGPMTAPHGPKP